MKRIPEFPEFKPLELSDREFVEARFMEHGSSACEMSFATQYMWKDFDRPCLTRINGNLCIFVEPINEPAFFLEPAGCAKPENTVGKCMEFAGRISRAGTSFVKGFALDGFKISKLRNHYDYIYNVKELAELKGRRFDGKRGHIKRFEKGHPSYGFLRMGAESAGAMLALFNKWCEKGPCPLDCGACVQHDCQRRALENCFVHFEELSLFGGGIWMGGELAGFAVASRGRADMANVHFMYALPDVPGLPEALLWEVCKDLLADYKLVNLEQDLGIEGVRKFKASYHPLWMEEKYQIER